MRFDGVVDAWGEAGRTPTGGMRLTVTNNLPVIREDGKIISQTYIEAVAESGLRAEAGEHRREPHRLRLAGKILSESSRTFWLSDAQIDELKSAGDGTLRVCVKDSVQVTTMVWPAASGIRLGESGQATGEVEVVVHTRHNTRFGATVRAGG